MKVLFDGVRYDGVTAAKDPVVVTVTATGLRVEGAEVTEWWPWDEVFRAPGQLKDEPVRLEWGKGEDTPALLVDDRGILAAIRDVAPDDLARHLRERHLPARLLAVLAGAAVAAAAAAYAWIIPGMATAVAAHIPVSWEEQLGQRVADAMAPAGERCPDRNVVGALEDIVRRLDAAGPSRYTWRLAVLRSDMVNAFAAPGGYIVVTTGLLRSSTRPEQVAGVLAHEMQHVIQQHGTRGLLRAAPLKLMLAAAAGDAAGLSHVLGAAANLGVLRYARRDEAAADRGGLATLRAARVDPNGLVEFFRVLADSGSDVPAGFGALSTHPRTAARIAELEAAIAAAPVRAAPVLAGEDWRALGARCTH